MALLSAALGSISGGQGGLSGGSSEAYGRVNAANTGGNASFNFGPPNRTTWTQWALLAGVAFLAYKAVK